MPWRGSQVPSGGSLYDPLVIASTYLMFVLLGQTVTTPPVQAGEWKLGGGTHEFVMEATGRATDPKGAALSLRSTSNLAGTSGSIMASLPANTLRGRRVTLSAELQVGSGRGAGLLIRTDSDTTVALTLENSLADPVRLEDGWRARSVSIPIPDNATVLAFGILLQGTGNVSARGVRLGIGRPFTGLPISEPAKKVVDEAISLAKGNALRRDSIDWKAVELQVRALAAGAQKSSEGYGAIQWLLTQLEDRRSYFVPASLVKEFWARSNQTPLPLMRARPDGVGYLSVPGYDGGTPDAMRAYVGGIHAWLSSTAARTPCGFMVDLRETTGGNPWPVLAGLKPLLGDKHPDDLSPSTSPWIVSNAVAVTPPARLKSLGAVRVAILIGPHTANSGESVTLALRERAQTRSFGQPTAGLFSVNSALPLSDGAMILLTTAPSSDRTGKPHHERLEPDELIAEPPGQKDGEGPTLSAAVRWLKQSPSCSPTSR